MMNMGALCSLWLSAGKGVSLANGTPRCATWVPGLNPGTAMAWAARTGIWASAANSSWKAWVTLAASR